MPPPPLATAQSRRLRRLRRLHGAAEGSEDPLNASGENGGFQVVGGVGVGVGPTTAEARGTMLAAAELGP